jgi:hypothetical protein
MNPKRKELFKLALKKDSGVQVDRNVMLAEIIDALPDTPSPSEPSPEETLEGKAKAMGRTAATKMLALSRDPDGPFFIVNNLGAYRYEDAGSVVLRLQGIKAADHHALETILGNSIAHIALAFYHDNAPVSEPATGLGIDDAMKVAGEAVRVDRNSDTSTMIVCSVEVGDVQGESQCDYDRTRLIPALASLLQSYSDRRAARAREEGRGEATK